MIKLGPDRFNTPLERYAALFERRAAPHPEYPDRTVDWPKPPLVGRVLPEGIEPLSKERDPDFGFDHDVKISSFMSEFAAGGVVFWGLGFEAEGIYHAHYGPQLCEWIKREFILTPVCLLSDEFDIVLIANDQMRFSVIGAPQPIMDRFDEIFSVTGNLRAEFIEFVDEQGVGYGEEDSIWSHNYLVKWSDWCE